MLDDGYITLHSASVLVTGIDHVFGESALTGSTSPPHVALVAAALATGLQPLFALRLVTALGYAAMLIAAGWLTAPLAWPRQAAIVTLAAVGLWLQAVNGLETGWTMAVAIVGLAAVQRSRPWLAAACAGLLPCLRPDMVPTAVVILGLAAWSQPWRVSAGLVMLATAVATPWLLFLHANTGAWLPATMNAKRNFFAEGCLPLNIRSGIAANGFRTFVVQAFPLSAGLAGLATIRLGRFGLLALLTALGAFALEFPGATFHNDYRYLTGISGPWFLLGLTALAARWPRRDLVTVALIAAAVAGAADRPPVLRQRRAAGELVAMATWVEAHSTPDDILLVHDAGAISVFADRRAVDLVGLKTPASAREHAQRTWPSCGGDRSATIASIARDSGATILVVTRDWDRIFQITAAIEAAGGRLDRLRAAPMGEGYDIYRMRF